MKERVSYIIVGLYSLGLLTLYISQSKKQIEYNPRRNRWL
jgi:hypothetical protein